VILLGLAFAVVVVVNLLASRANTRWDWTSGGVLRLSEKTERFLREQVDTQPHPVRLYVFYPPANAYALATRRGEVFGVHHLARELALASDRVVIETLDPEQNRGRVDELRRQFDITGEEFANGVVAFEHRGKTRYVTDQQLFEVDVEARRAAGNAVVARRFLGEDRFLAVLQGLVLGSAPKAAILVGHGELDPTSQDPERTALRVETALKRDTFEVDVLDLKGHDVIRKDYDVICVLGPRQPLPPTAVAALRAHCARGGGLLVCAAPNLDPRPDGQVVVTPTGLEEFLADWGVQLTEDLVMASATDPTGQHRMFSPTFVPAMEASHPVSRSFTRERNRLVPFGFVRSTPYDDQGRSRTIGTVIAATDDGGRRITDFVAYLQVLKDPASQQAFLEDPKRHPPSAVPVACAVESLRPGTGTGLPTRLVVFGSTAWCDDSGRSGDYAMDLFLSAVNWIARREMLTGIGAKDPHRVRFAMTPGAIRLVAWVGMGLLPLGVGLLGAVVWLIRKREW
jgi:hypothetical protein